MKCKATTKNSLIFEKRYKILVSFLSILFVLMAGSTTMLQAQMFSVGESGSRYSAPFSEVYIGLESMEATYKGAQSVNSQVRPGAFEYSGPVIKMGYNTTDLDLFLATGGKITGVDEGAYFHTGGNLDFGINLYRSQKLLLQIPLRLSSRYTNITNNQTINFQSVNRFQYGMISGGVGVRGELRPTKKIRARFGTIPGYGFSFATGGFLGGSIGVVDAFGKLYIDRLYNNLGLSVGYKYDFRSYDVEDEVYDYDLSGHSIEIGVTF
ncbi:hypothetical protein CK503_03990 [Aliifodinibius salipaludis]|uniref:Uncharacterized protein n=1 Tax=Fodinibius salipaludis TaxID=2032627 RepID=A0A2A2GEE9_9BACT|nr:hypothetical protein [Aliifodinibius salipaludis]PAU95364.1 hypothetical protein CK503_03990 [Aliifodinibius salipaludis]